MDANATNISSAISWINSINSASGTDMLTPYRAAVDTLVAQRKTGSIGAHGALPPGFIPASKKVVIANGM